MKRLLLLGISFSITGCVGNTPKVSVQDALAPQRTLGATAELQKNRVANQEDSKEKTISWRQPQNKKESCKLSFDEGWPEDIEIFWDGGCKDGYAFGVGREFVKGMIHDGPVDVVDLAHYKGGRVAATYLYTYDRVNNRARINAYDSEEHFIDRLLKQDGSVVSLSTEYYNYGKIKESGYIYTGLTTSLNNDVLYGKVVDRNNAARFYTIEDHNIKARYLDGTFEIHKMADGEVIHIQRSRHNEWARTTLPKAYIDNAETSINEMVEAMDETQEKLKKSLGMIDYYIRKTCQNQVVVDFIPNNEYKEICGDFDYFSSYVDKINKSRKEELTKRKHQYDQWVQKREQQAIAKAKEKQETSAAIRSLTNAVNSFNQGLNKRSQSAWNAANSVGSQNYNYNTDPYGRSNSSSNRNYGGSSSIYNYYNINGNTVTGSDGTNCFVVGGVINCQ
tara:strand:+ start:4223 stop:5566 length:1344 start_codon:yes stop_codon:yes gene_type:complete